MNKILFLLSLILSPFCYSQSGAGIRGTWRFYKMIINGIEYEPRDPRLNLKFSFNGNNESRLYWTYDEGKTFCERKGYYQYQDEILMDIVTWVNPQNRQDCSLDVDMQLGHQSKSSLRRVGWEIILSIPFGEKTIEYVWVNTKFDLED